LKRFASTDLPKQDQRHPRFALGDTEEEANHLPIHISLVENFSNASELEDSEEAHSPSWSKASCGPATKLLSLGRQDDLA
jgi:hypothetical protein